jgi:ABC-type spermidine/putrescine transport system permease subunit I
MSHAPGAIAAPFAAADGMRGTVRRPAKALRRAFGGALGAPMLLWQFAFFLGPLLFLVWMTFWRVKNFRLTPDFVLDNWERLLNARYLYDAFLYTATISIAAAVLATVVAFPAAYALAFRMSPAARRWAIFLLIVPFFTSYLVRIYAWEIILSDKGVINYLLRALGLGTLPLLNNAFGSLVGYLTLSLPLVVLIQLFALSNVEPSLIEAAHNLRCSPLRTVFTVIVPAARTGLVLAATFAFILSFGDYVSPTLLGGGKPPTLSILITDQVKSGNHWPRAAVVAVIMVVTLTVSLLAVLRVAYGRPVRAS